MKIVHSPYSNFNTIQKRCYNFVLTTASKVFFYNINDENAGEL